jgi:hypothetical protein
MEGKRVQTCKWAGPTLQESWPLWIDAWAWPWTCRADGAPRLLATTSDCLECARWEGRDPGATGTRFTGGLSGRRCGPS